MPDRLPNILWYCTDQQRFDTIGWAIPTLAPQRLTGWYPMAWLLRAPTASILFAPRAVPVL